MAFFEKVIVCKFACKMLAFCIVVEGKENGAVHCKDVVETHVASIDLEELLILGFSH